MNIVLRNTHKGLPIVFQAQPSRPDMQIIKQLKNRLQQLDELVGKLTYSLREIKSFGARQKPSAQSVRANIIRLSQKWRNP